MTEPSHYETSPLGTRSAVPQAASCRSILVCLNRRAGSGARHAQVERILRTLEERDFTTKIVRDLEEIAAASDELLRTQQFRAVMAIGGDGTASAVRARVPLEIPLLVVPMGTENLLGGRYLRQSTAAESVLDVIENGVVIELDLGWANDKSFLLMVSAGFDAEVIRTLHENRRGNIRRTTYLFHVLSALKSYAFRPMRIYWNATDKTVPESTCCRWLFGFNLPLYALGLPIAAKAVGIDGLLNVCAFKRGSIWSIARYLWHVARQTHDNLPDAVTRKTQRFRLESADNSEIAFQLDGDFGGMLPVDVHVVPKQLRLLVSRETAERLGFVLPPTSVRIS